VSIEIAGAFYSAKNLCRIFSQFEKSKNEIAPKNVDSLTTDELCKLKSVDPRQRYIEYYRGSVTFFMQTIQANRKTRYEVFSVYHLGFH